MRTAYTYEPSHVHHAYEGNPEHPRRLAAVVRHLERCGLLDRLAEVPTRAAPREALERVHDAAYLDLLDATAEERLFDYDTYVTARSAEIARRGLGGLLGLVDAVLGGEADNGLALIRPPGHHARSHTAMGFCLLGNVAVAARHARAVHGVERVLVVDFDVHHGNGTQEMFYDDRDVLVVSSHRYPFYPGTGALGETGAGAGAGATVNVPLPAGVGDAALLELYRRVLPPLAARHRPELVLVSAGYDAHASDPLGDTALTERGYAELTRLLMELADVHCDGRLVGTLEGGYDPDALAASVAATLAVLGDPTAEVETDLAPPAGPDLARLTEDLRSLHGLG